MDPGEQVSGPWRTGEWTSQAWRMASRPHFWSMCDPLVLWRRLCSHSPPARQVHASDSVAYTSIHPPAGDTIHLRHIIPCLLDGGLIGTFQMDSSFMRGASPSYASPEEVADMEERAWKQEQVV